MGQTLTHGVYLPDEGERNCYSGLAANWQILDNSVGTIAANTAALAGKAPLVHTHTVSQITDFPAYGNAAGTICEGNDSRLSDARTPVAHTHTKSDVTDLLNSNFIPSANNSYDLGFSSYQWNNIYAKNYYYNGVAWGLDKENTWTRANSFYKSIQIRGGRNAYIMPEFSASYSGLAFGTVEFKQSFKFGDWVDNNSTIGINTSNAYVEIYAGLDSSDNVNKARLNPVNTTVAELGTSTNKWKTLNGVNPGALSLPDYNRFEPIDFSQYDVNLGWNNLYTPSEDGWLYAEIDDTATNSIYLYSAGLQPVQSVNRKYGVSAHGNGSQSSYGGRLAIMVPVRKDIQYRFMIKASAVSDIYAVIFYPCLGNV